MSAHAHDHSSSARVYVFVLLGLLFLTAITVGAAYVNFGSSAINLAIAVLIATVKASLVALFFMHLRHDPPLNGIIFVTSLIFLGLFILFPAIDLGSREKVVPYGLRVQNPPPGAAAAKPAPAATPAAAPAQH